MSITIHPTAIIDPLAELDDGCQIGPYCVVGPGVHLGRDSVLIAHVVLSGLTTLGEQNILHPFAVLGEAPQHRLDRGEQGRVILGDRNVLREHVTIHRATSLQQGVTRLGNDNLLMVGSHVAHDVSLGSWCNLANHALLAGHVQVEDYVFFGGGAAIHQHVRIGEGAMIAAGAGVSMDVPPFALACGDRARLIGVHTEGLKRRQRSPATLNALKHAFRFLFRQHQLWRQQLPLLQQEWGHIPEIAHLVAFLQQPSRRGITHSH